MKRSECYRLVKNGATGVTEYILTPSYLEVFKDEDGNEYRIHIHKIEVAPKIFKWSATEESTGLKCSIKDYTTKAECYEGVKGILPAMKKCMSMHNHYIEKLRDFKDKHNLK